MWRWEPESDERFWKELGKRATPDFRAALDYVGVQAYPVESDLVDQVNLMVFSVVLGTGKKAFEETPQRRKLRLNESKIVGDGVLVLVYERAV